MEKMKLVEIIVIQMKTLNHIACNFNSNLDEKKCDVKW
jgi:hypothetical protein